MNREITYVFTWGNNSKRETLKGRECRILAHGKKRSVRVEFENGQLEIVDLFALRKKTDSKHSSAGSFLTHSEQMKLFPF